MTNTKRPESDSQFFSRRDLIAEWKDIQPQMGKHVASNNHTCKRIIAELEDAGMQEAASWGRWMVWHLELREQQAQRFADERPRGICK